MQRCIIHPPKCCVFIFIYVIYLPETQNCTAVNAKVYSPESYRKRVFMLTETVSLPCVCPLFIYRRLKMVKLCDKHPKSLRGKYTG